jgi:hypothetical protein
MQAHTPRHVTTCSFVCTARRPSPHPPGLRNARAPSSPRIIGFCVIWEYKFEFEFGLGKWHLIRLIKSTSDRRGTHAGILLGVAYCAVLHQVQCPMAKTDLTVLRKAKNTRRSKNSIIQLNSYIRRGTWLGVEGTRAGPLWAGAGPMSAPKSPGLLRGQARLPR